MDYGDEQYDEMGDQQQMMEYGEEGQMQYD